MGDIQSYTASLPGSLELTFSHLLRSLVAVFAFLQYKLLLAIHVTQGSNGYIITDVRHGGNNIEITLEVFFFVSKITFKYSECFRLVTSDTSFAVL